MRKLLPFLLFFAVAAHAALPDGLDDQAIRRSAAAVFPDYFELLSMPSDSIKPEDIQKNAAWLVKAFEKRGFKAKELDNKGRPLVFASYSGNTGRRPTILFYIHFDGQPVIPAQWAQKDPWSPVVKKRGPDGKWGEVDKSELFRPDFDPELRVFGRASADDKGPIAMFLASFDLMREKKQLPAVDVKLLLDSEEESNSAGIPAVVAANEALLKADAMVVFDAAEHPSGRPTIVFGNRGVTPLTLTVYGPKVPLHSGHYGNYAPNPAQRLARLLAGMKDEDGRVTVPGYYDHTHFTDTDRKIMAEVPDDEAALKKRLGISETDKVGATYQEALQYPSLNIRGMAAGGIGDKVATIIPGPGGRRTRSAHHRRSRRSLSLRFSEGLHRQAGLFPGRSRPDRRGARRPWQDCAAQDRQGRRGRAPGHELASRTLGRQGVDPVRGPGAGAAAPDGWHGADRRHRRAAEDAVPAGPDRQCRRQPAHL